MNTETVGSLGDLPKLLKQRPTRKANPHGGWTNKATPIKWARIIAFIAHYQKDNEGKTPSGHTIANEIGVGATTIMFHLRRMEDKGLIHIYSTAPLRIMLVDKPADLESARRLDSAFKGKRLPAEIEAMSKRERFEGADANRMRVGHAIAHCWRDKGRGPSLNEIADFIGFQSTNHVLEMVKILEDRGLVEGRHHERKLTETGKIVFGDKQEDKVERKVILIPTKQNEAPRAKRLYREIAKFLEGYSAAHSYAPEALEIAQATGVHRTTICRAIAYMAAKGWVSHKKSAKRDYALTEEGRQALLPPHQRAAATTPPPITTPEEQMDNALKSGAMPTEAMGHRSEAFVEYRPVNPMSSLANVPTGELLAEIIERGYTVRKG